MDADQTPVQQQNGQPTHGQEPPGQHLQPFPPLPTSQPATSSNDLLRQAEQVMALIQQRHSAASSFQRRRKHSIGDPDQQRQQQLSGRPAGGQRPSGQSPTLSSTPPGRQQPPTDDDLLFQCVQMMMLIVQQRQANLNPGTITAMARNAIQSDAIITHPAIFKQQTLEHDGSTTLASPAVKASNTSVHHLQQLAGEPVDDVIIIIDQHNGRQLVPGGPRQLLGFGSSGSSITLSLSRGTFGCHHADSVSTCKAFSRQKLIHSKEVEWSSHHFASINAHCWLLHCCRLPSEVFSGPVHHANGPCIEARTIGVSVVEPSAHHRSALWQQKRTDMIARLLPCSTPASTAIQRGAFHGPNHHTVPIGHSSIGVEMANGCADNGIHATTALSQRVVISHREGGGASGSSSSTLLRASSEVCPSNLLSSSDESAKRNQTRERVGSQPSIRRPSRATNSWLPLDILSEWQLPRPPQDDPGPSPNADVSTPTPSPDGESTTHKSSVASVPPSTPGREPTPPQQSSASAGSPASEPSSSSSQSTSTSISGSTATTKSVVVQPHRSSWTMRARQAG